MEQESEPGTAGLRTVLFSVSDLGRSKAVYSALLGVEPGTESSHYMGFDVAGLHVGLLPSGGPSQTPSPVGYWHVDDIEAKVAKLVGAGATVREAPRHVGGGRWVASIADPDGNVIGLIEDRHS
jgi:predicted enzyme related to lactoylglutathione lyase